MLPLTEGRVVDVFAFQIGVDARRSGSDSREESAMDSERVRS
jgi:hypothetical protein